jgi:hypothetical protein
MKAQRSVLFRDFGLPLCGRYMRLAPLPMPQAKRSVKRYAHSGVILLSFCLMSALTGCPKPEKPSTTNPQQPITRESPKAIDVCSLLTSQEIEAIQGAPLKDTKPSVNSQGGLNVSQCYFLLPVAADSIVLTVTKGNGLNSRDSKQSWERIFRGDQEEEREREKQESKAPPPEKIGGLGDEAFWAPRRFGGTLYALKGDTYISLSVGGSGDQATKLQKSKALAEIVLKRL